MTRTDDADLELDFHAHRVRIRSDVHRDAATSAAAGNRVGLALREKRSWLTGG
jgi:hypothetical protein